MSQFLHDNEDPRLKQYLWFSPKTKKKKPHLKSIENSIKQHTTNTTIHKIVRTWAYVIQEQTLMWYKNRLSFHISGQGQLIYSETYNLILSQSSPGFYVSLLQALRTHCRKRRNCSLLEMSNFCFSHSVFYQSGELSAIFIQFEIVVCTLFQFGRV